MEPEVLSEAKDFVTGWIDKAGADGAGINYEVRASMTVNKFRVCLGCVQRY